MYQAPAGLFPDTVSLDPCCPHWRVNPTPIDTRVPDRVLCRTRPVEPRMRPWKGSSAGLALSPSLGQNLPTPCPAQGNGDPLCVPLPTPGRLGHPSCGTRAPIWLRRPHLSPGGSRWWGLWVWGGGHWEGPPCCAVRVSGQHSASLAALPSRAQHGVKCPPGIRQPVSS